MSRVTTAFLDLPPEPASEFDDLPGDLDRSGVTLRPGRVRAYRVEGLALVPQHPDEADAARTVAADQARAEVLRREAAVLEEVARQVAPPPPKPAGPTPLLDSPRGRR